MSVDHGMCVDYYLIFDPEVRYETDIRIDWDMKGGFWDESWARDESKLWDGCDFEPKMKLTLMFKMTLRYIKFYSDKDRLW
jgi:hypothetical protein